MWTLPTFEASSARKILGANIIFASDEDVLPPSDPKTGVGAFSKELYPVRVPSTHCLVEAYVRLIEREYNEYDVSDDREWYWRESLERFVRHLNHLREPVQVFYMHPACREFFHALRDSKNTVTALAHLRRSMGGNRKARKQTHSGYSLLFVFIALLLPSCIYLFASYLGGKPGGNCPCLHIE